ncbi:MAG: electron transport complex subunit E [SAR324 cluster bacterium]|nr:electron transport complex subunit E [SAR324 cluster bacterium]
MSSTNETTSADLIIKRLWEENPVFVQLLGMCPILAVSNSVINAVSMGLATMFVLVMSSALVSALRNFIPKQVRIATYILIIATFVTVAEYIIQAISLDIHKSLGAFISLIVVNCIILGQAESFASKNKVIPSIIASTGTGAGFVFAITCMGSFREVIGNGSFAGIPLFGPNYQPWIVMILPGGGFFALGILLMIYNRINRWYKATKTQPAVAKTARVAG